MKISIGCDHGALNLKNKMVAHLTAKGHEVVDFGTYTPTGANGKFTGKGYLYVTPNGGDVNGVREMTVTLAVTVPFVKESA